MSRQEREAQREEEDLQEKASGFRRTAAYVLGPPAPIITPSYEEYLHTPFESC